jgi:hypothetical protein
VGKVVKCPYCGYEGESKVHKTWRFRFYEVKRLECPKCHGVFNHYYGVSSKGTVVEFTIRIKPRISK